MESVNPEAEEWALSEALYFDVWLNLGRVWGFGFRGSVFGFRVHGSVFWGLEIWM
jgi:hypothetical protein